MIHADIEHLSRQVDEHRATLDRMDKSPGVGYIAQEGRKPAPDPLPKREIPPKQRGDPSHERFLAEHSALQKKYPNAEFLSVGAPWIEAKPEGNRIYRVLEVRDPKTGEVLVRREEIRSLGSDGKPIDHWVQRGSEGNVSGEIGEEAFRLKFEATGEHAREILLPHDVVQLGGGQGFDGVIVRFDPYGQATVVLVEVKNYPGRQVPLIDITAINDNLNTNLQRLTTMLNDPKEFARLGLDPMQAALAAHAIENNQLKFEVHVGETTKLADVNNLRGSVLESLRSAIQTERKLLSLPDVSKKIISSEHLSAAKALIEARERLGDDKMLRSLAKEGGSSLTAEGVRRAEAALTAQRALPAVMEHPLSPGKERGTFVDAKQNPFIVLAPEPGAKAPTVVDEIAKTLRAAESTSGNPAHIVVDITEFDLGERATLRHQLGELANKNPPLVLDRLLLVDVRRGFAGVFDPSSKVFQ
jgi:hypothetical protein